MIVPFSWSTFICRSCYCTFLIKVRLLGTLLSTDSHNSTLEANAHSSQEAKLRYYTTAMKELGIHVPFTSLHPNNEPNVCARLHLVQS